MGMEVYEALTDLYRKIEKLSEEIQEIKSKLKS